MEEDKREEAGNRKRSGERWRRKGEKNEEGKDVIVRVQ